MTKATKQPNKTAAVHAASDPAPSAAFEQLLDQIKDAPMTVLDLARMSKEARAEWLKNNPPGPPTMRSSPFEIALQGLAGQAAGPHNYGSAKGTGRRLLLTRALSQELRDDDLLTEVGNYEDAISDQFADARCANFDDVAAKLAGMVLLAEGFQDIEVIRRGLATCLAEMVLLGDKPLPSIAPLLVMNGADAEMRDMPVESLREGAASAR